MVQQDIDMKEEMKRAHDSDEYEIDDVKRDKGCCRNS